jgi:hypothetical protein
MISCARQLKAENQDYPSSYILDVFQCSPAQFTSVWVGNKASLLALDLDCLNRQIPLFLLPCKGLVLVTRSTTSWI